MNGDFQQGPQQDPGTQRNLLLAFALTILVILLAQPLLQKYGPKPAEKPAQPAQPVAQQPAPSAAPAPSAPAAPQPAAAPSEQAAAESEIVVENDLYKITFTNRGARVKSWVLKKFDDDKGKPLELVNQISAPQYGYPLSLWSYDADLRNQLNSALYVPAIEQSMLMGEQVANVSVSSPAAPPVGTSIKPPASLTFSWSAGGLVVRKTFRFDHSYVVAVESSVQRNGQWVQAYPAWPPGFGDQASPSSYAASSLDSQSGGKITRVAPKKVSGGNTVPGPLEWAGTVDQYFAAVFLPSEPQSAALITLHESIKIPKDFKNPDPKETMDAPVLGAAVGDTRGPTRERLFVGPKDLDLLKTVAVGPSDSLEDLANFGFFSVIAKPLFLWLKWTHLHWVGNWGWAIVILTVIINLALIPLKLSSMKSALKMQKAQPQMKAIREKYRKYKLGDPRKQQEQQEIAELFKRENINPLGGCWPMLLQLPFLYAFYAMLGTAMELRHAAWLWIPDLSSPDPAHLLPIAIVVSMFLMQKVTPAAGMDPVQQKMMSFTMPLFMGFLFWNFAAGLCLYFVASNLLGWGQQLWMNQTAFGREMREHMAKRQRKT